MGRLSGKVALITGTAGGQGRAAALAFAREGAKVVGCDMKAEAAEKTVELVRAEGGEMTSMAPVDLSDERQATDWVNQAAEVYGGVDVLYNNAALGRIGPLMGMSTDAWHFTLRHELDVIFFVTRAAWPHLVARGGGSIINTGSIIGGRGSDMPMAAHGTGKAGVIGLTRHLALEGGPSGIRANCISPGLIATEMFEQLMKDPNDNLHKQIRTSPLGRVGLAEDVAPLAVFLASDESSYITGANIPVDGGQTLGIGMSFGEAPQFADAAPAISEAGGEEWAIDTPDGALRITASIGFASFPLGGQGTGSAALRLHWEQAVNWVDMVLYKAKAEGRNRGVGINGVEAPDADTLAAILQDFDAACLHGQVRLNVLVGPA